MSMNHLLGMTVCTIAFILLPAEEGFTGGIAMEKEGGAGMGTEVVKKVLDQMTPALNGDDARRLKKGLEVVSQLWRKDDGDEKAFTDFCVKYFIPSGEMLDRTFERFEKNLEALSGNMLIISREFSEPVQLDVGDPLPVDYIFAEFSPSAHVLDDLFADKLAFIALLNFPPATLEEKLASGPGWTRKEWAEARLSEGFRDRIPASVNQKLSETFTKVDNYISEYNVYSNRLLGDNGQHLFSESKKLISHWGLRDELKAQYAKTDALPRQEAIYAAMKRVIDGSIPREVINSDKYFWKPSSNVLVGNDGGGDVKSAGGENDGRYEQLRQVFLAETMLDPFTPDAPTHVLRRFNRDRQIPEKEVERLLVSVLESPQAKETGSVISRRLGRSLRPFDIWYSGFKSGQDVDEDKLDKIVREKYPTLEAFKKDIPGILQKLGFSAGDARFLAAHIEVDPARGSGHAMGAETRTDKAHLRTRVPKGGMNYKGFNIAMHELGHCVEQVLTLNRMDYYSLRGVPNTAFTESWAFTFQAKDLEVLGVSPKDKSSGMKALNDFWMTYEISGVSLVDMRVWRWMYGKKIFTADELKNAVIKIAVDVWNQYYAPVFGVKDEPILAVYSHMIGNALYLPDYALGHLIDFQIGRQAAGKNLASEMKRMLASGSITPDAWMKAATGGPLSAAPLLDSAAEALKEIQKSGDNP